MQVPVAETPRARSVASDLGHPLPAFRSLDWRLDVQMGSRCLRGQATPKMTIKLETEEGGRPTTEFLQADLADMEHMCREIKNALQEGRSNHARRVSRSILLDRRCAI